MTTRKRIRTRRLRRQAKQVRKNGPAAKSRHVALGGRTGSIRAKRLGGRLAESPVTNAVLRRKAMAPRPSLVRRIDPRDGVTVLGYLDPYDPSRNPFRHAHAGSVSRKRRP